MNHAIAAYPETRANLAEVVRDIILDVTALQRPLRRCDLSGCGGACCHDGVYLSAEESRVIRETVDQERTFFAKLGLELPERPIVYGNWRNQISGPKTATREEKKMCRSDYPNHFPATSCVFLLPDARCAWQVWSEKNGHHPWALKPLTCWLHPLSITRNSGGDYCLTLYNEDSDPQRFDDYDGFICRTGCGQTDFGGKPAWETLHEELVSLGEIGQRDFVKEIQESLSEG